MGLLLIGDSESFFNKRFHVLPVAIRTLNVEPFPTSLSTLIVPPRSSNSRFTI